MCKCVEISKRRKLPQNRRRIFKRQQNGRFHISERQNEDTQNLKVKLKKKEGILSWNRSRNRKTCNKNGTFHVRKHHEERGLSSLENFKKDKRREGKFASNQRQNLSKDIRKKIEIRNQYEAIHPSREKLQKKKLHLHREIFKKGKEKEGKEKKQTI